MDVTVGYQKPDNNPLIDGSVTFDQLLDTYDLDPEETDPNRLPYPSKKTKEAYSDKAPLK